MKNNEHSKERGFMREFLINFALVYSLIIGIIFVTYSIYRGLFQPFYYFLVLIIFLFYFFSWVYDKKRNLDEKGTTN